MRRLPVYLLLDCSDSMVGEPLLAIEKGVELLLRELRKNPHALETVHLSIISFSSVARLIMPLTELTEVQPPSLRIGPGTALGAAVRLLRQRIEVEVRPTTRERKGDYLPLVFVLTDGMPTDSVEEILEAAQHEGGTRLGSIYCVGCGEDVDFEVLQQLGDGVFRLDEMSEEQVRSLFLWLTASVQTASVAVESSGLPTDSRLALNRMPESISLMKKGATPRPAREPRIIMLKGVCSHTGDIYLMRYVRGGLKGDYRPVSVHPLDPEQIEEESSHFGGLGPIRSSRLEGVTHCGHCDNPGAGVCGRCQTLFCLPEVSPPEVQCPTCKTRISVREGGDFDIHQRSD